MDTKASTLDPALLQLVTEMNLYGTVYSCNAVASIMKQQRSGKIITVSSVAGTAHRLLMAVMPLWRSEGCYRSITRGIWPRISGLSGLRATVSPPP
jgi:NAD(P)-dependent dehydrogenase (short-subunit alcohol dehydrogenase family)